MRKLRGARGAGQTRLTRRLALAGGSGGLTALLAACAGPTSPVSTTSSPARTAIAEVYLIRRELIAPPSCPKRRTPRTPVPTLGPPVLIRHRYSAAIFLRITRARVSLSGAFRFAGFGAAARRQPSRSRPASSASVQPAVTTMLSGERTCPILAARLAISRRR